MAQNKQQFVRTTTPVGIARYPWLNKPDTKFKAQGEYKVDLIVSRERAAALVAQVNKVAKEMLAETQAANPKKAKTMKLASHSVVAETDDEGNETGNTIFKLRQYASFESKKTGEVFTKTIPLFDAAGKKCSPMVGGGSKLKANIELYPWYSAKDNEVGVKLRLNAVQIIDLVEYGSGGSADQFGFGKEEGGFEAGDDSFEDEAENVRSDIVDESDDNENDDLY